MLRSLSLELNQIWQLLFSIPRGTPSSTLIKASNMAASVMIHTQLISEEGIRVRLKSPTGLLVNECDSQKRQQLHSIQSLNRGLNSPQHSSV